MLARFHNTIMLRPINYIIAPTWLRYILPVLLNIIYYLNMLTLNRARVAYYTLLYLLILFHLENPLFAGLAHYMVLRPYNNIML